MLTIVQELAATPSARWYELARNKRGPASWQERVLCFEALTSLLDEQHMPRVTGQRRRERALGPPSLAKVAARTGAIAQSTMYSYWGPVQGIKTVPRWAGSQALAPGAAFIDEAKVASFWPYRQGLLQVADVMEMTAQEIFFGYMRAVAVWAADQPTLSACEPIVAPGCVREDAAVLVRRSSDGRLADNAITDSAEELATLAGQVVVQMLDDASLTPLGAFNVIREDVVRLLAGQPNPLFPRVSAALVELADALLHKPEGDALLTSAQSADLQGMMTGLLTLMTEPEAPDADK